MSWESCIVLMNSDSTGSFYTGDIVTGSVVLEFKHRQKIEYINFKVIGVCKAYWSRSKPVVPYIQVYSDRKVVLDLEIDVFVDLDGKKVEPGISTFHFHFLLPPNLPSTFESAIGKVHYYIQIDGKASFKFKKHKVVPFIVQGKINVNDNEEYLAPTFTEFKKNLWKAGEIKIFVKSLKAFAPKQHAPFEITLTNEKKAKISKINVILLQKIKYITSSGFADEEKKVCKIGHTKLSNTVTETCVISMEIPPTIPSSIHLIRPMIDISYVFRVEVIFSFRTAVYKDIPVLMTTIPVMHYEFENCL